jgi:hypothetical protein
MPFDPDETNPLDNSIVASFPANERDSRAAIVGLLDVEHEHSVGRHKFPAVNTAARDAISDWQVGSMCFNSDTSPAVLQRVVSIGPVVWENLDVDIAEIVRRDQQNLFTVAQLADWAPVTPTPGATDLLVIDLDLSPFKWATITNDTEIQKPTNGVANHTAVITLDIIMDGVGGHTITHEGSSFYAPGGVANYATGANERTLVTITADKNDDWIISTRPNFFVEVP